MEQTLGIDLDMIVRVSAKTGLNIDQLIDSIIEHVPAPGGDPDAPLQAMVFVSHHDEFRGAITYVRVMNGTLEKGQKVRFLRAGTNHEVQEFGRFCLKQILCDELVAGQVGYVIANSKSLTQVNIGDTLSTAGPNTGEPLDGYKEPKRMVYCGLYPSDGQDFTELRVSRTASHGDRAAAVGAGIRCRSSADCAECDIRSSDQRRQGAGDSQTAGCSGLRQHRRAPPADCAS